MKKIILLGYMGSGKSLIAPLLAQKMRLPCLDMDRVIEAKTGKTVAEIFKNEGEISFRKIEHEMFSALMRNDESFVLGLGGGTPCYAGNHLLLKGDGIRSVYLKTSIEELMRRLQNEKNKRPLLNGLDDAQMHEFIATNLFERSYFYHHATDIVTTDGKSPDEIASEICALI